MLTMRIEPKINGNHTSAHVSQNLLLKPTKTSISLKPKTSSFDLCLVSDLKRNHSTRKVKISASSAAANAILAKEPSANGFDSETSPDKEKLGVVVKPMGKPRLVLKFIWMQKEIGIALDQTVPGHGTIPLSPYYFWPRKDAWEELKVLLESKPWISPLQRINLLNQATDLINLWQASGGNI